MSETSWQPISTAPEDQNSYILVAYRAGDGRWYALPVRRLGPVFIRDDGIRVTGVTLWTRIPEFPDD